MDVYAFFSLTYATWEISTEYPSTDIGWLMGLQELEEPVWAWMESRFMG